MCVLVVCLCVHVDMLVLGSLRGARTYLALKWGSSLFSHLQKIGWHCDEFIERSWSGVSFFSLKTGMQIQRVLELIYIVLPSLPWLLFSLLPDNPDKQCFTPSPPTSACMVTALWA